MKSLRSAVLTAFCGFAVATSAVAAQKPAALPVADPPAVLGEAYTAGGVTYVPADAPFDDVGYAGLDDSSGPGISVAHRTLPLPSYVEITALGSGRTILARVERRGPMTGDQIVALSAAAFAQLEEDPGKPLAVRVRRVNPQEYERALLRTNQRAPERLVTPGPLVEVLRKLLVSKQIRATDGVVDPEVTMSVPVASANPPKQVPIKPASARSSATKPVIAKPVVAKSSPTNPAPAIVTQPPAPGTFAVQVAAFASRANADAAAKALGGKVGASGTLWKVRLGPFAQRAAAEAGLARAKKAGFADARIVSAGK